MIGQFTSNHRWRSVAIKPDAKLPFCHQEKEGKKSRKRKCFSIFKLVKIFASMKRSTSSSPTEPEPVAKEPRRSRYYKQAYRKEWESMPDFRGWLTGLPGHPQKAYCLYCAKSLHAHRLSLLKHTVTLRHTSAALTNYAQANITVRYENNSATSPEHEPSCSPISTPSASPRVSLPMKARAKHPITITPVISIKEERYEAAHGSSNKIPDEDSNCEDNNIGIADTSAKMTETDDSDEERNEEEGAETSQTLCKVSENQKKNPSNNSSLPEAPPVAQDSIRPKVVKVVSEHPVSTHVLDTAKGMPVGNLHICLYKLVEGRWTAVGEGITTPDGRCNTFIKREDFVSGRYKLHFDVDRYFEIRKQDSLYPFIEIVFDARSSMEHYHVPLLLSPFGYTTYRGS